MNPKYEQSSHKPSVMEANQGSNLKLNETYVLGLAKDKVLKTVKDSYLYNVMIGKSIDDYDWDLANVDTFSLFTNIYKKYDTTVHANGTETEVESIESNALNMYERVLKEGCDYSYDYMRIII